MRPCRQVQGVGREVRAAAESTARHTVQRMTSLTPDSCKAIATLCSVLFFTSLFEAMTHMLSALNTFPTERGIINRRAPFGLLTTCCRFWGRQRPVRELSVGLAAWPLRAAGPVHPAVLCDTHVVQLLSHLQPVLLDAWRLEQHDLN